MNLYEAQARLVAITMPCIDDAPHVKTPEDFIVWAAKVSNPEGQTKDLNGAKLISYLIRNEHWSPFEMASLSIEIKVPRDISRQILRHRSFSFQEYSGRYAKMNVFCKREARLQDAKNRQASNSTQDSYIIWEWDAMQEEHAQASIKKYERALKLGIAKEQARALLPEGMTMSTLIMSGTLRSWIHYCTLRSGNGTQKEHAEIARMIYEEILTKKFPAIATAMQDLRKTNTL